MEPALILAVVLVVPPLLALLAIQFGADTRFAYRSPEEVQASSGLRTGTPLPFRLHGRSCFHVSNAQNPSRAPYPTLALIDQARGNQATPFASDPNAPELERQARTLTNDYWPNSVWWTGLVSPAQLDAIVSRLEAERERGHDAIRVLVVTEPAASDQPAVL